MRYTSAERMAQGGLVAFALVFALVAFTVLFRGGDGGPGATASPSATAVSRAPDVTITQATCCTQTARLLLATWESSPHQRGEGHAETGSRLRVQREHRR